MSKLNLLKPDLKNLYTYVYTGSFLILISSLDVFLNSFFDINITSFLPQLISFILPLIIGLIGLHFIRIEFTGIKNLDLLNKHINTNNFNALLTLSIVFVIICLNDTMDSIVFFVKIYLNYTFVIWGDLDNLM